MKRVFAFLLSFCFVFLPLLYAVPARAEETPWSTLFYTVDPENEGETGASGQLLRNGEMLTIPRKGTVSCDPARARIYVNGEKSDSGSFRLEKFGKYTVKVESLDGAGAVTYTVQELPDLGFYKSHVFTEFPVITCRNSDKYEVKNDKGHILPVGEQITQFGRFTVTVYGENAEGDLIEDVYEFFVRYCSVELGINQETGKRALMVSVGSFPGYTIHATLDGAPLEAGTTAVSAVGQHRLEATVAVGDGEPEPADVMLMPQSTELLLQVRVRLSDTVSNEPYQLDFSEWDADFYLDDQPFSGAIRVVEAGTHTLTVRNADGTVMKNAFLLAVGEEETLKPVDSISFTFHNPHRTIAWIAVVPAVLLLGAAVYLLVVRRKVV